MSMRGTVIKLSLFVVLSLVATWVVISTLYNPVGGDTSDYSAVLEDATGLVAGSDVQVSGVRVGRVTSVALEDGHAVVDFAMAADQHIPSDGRIVVRYADLLGSRSLTVEPGPSGKGATDFQTPGTEIPMDRTEPAINLTAILNGFKPLFESLDPDEVNQLTGEIVSVFQGQGATVQSLLQRTVAVTQNLGPQGQIIDQVLANLNGVLQVTMTNRPNFVSLITSLNSLVGGLADERGQIGDTVTAASELAGNLAAVTDRTVPQLTPTLSSAAQAADTISGNAAAVNQGIVAFQEIFTRLGQVGSYGSWLNIYVCNLSVSALGYSADLGAGPQRSVMCR